MNSLRSLPNLHALQSPLGASYFSRVFVNVSVRVRVLWAACSCEHAHAWLKSRVCRAHIVCHPQVFVLTLFDYSTFLSLLTIFSLIILSFVLPINFWRRFCRHSRLRRCQQQRVSTSRSRTVQVTEVRNAMVEHGLTLKVVCETNVSAGRAKMVDLRRTTLPAVAEAAKDCRVLIWDVRNMCETSGWFWICVDMVIAILTVLSGGLSATLHPDDCSRQKETDKNAAWRRPMKNELQHREKVFHIRTAWNPVVNGAALWA